MIIEVNYVKPAYYRVQTPYGKTIFRGITLGNNNMTSLLVNDSNFTKPKNNNSHRNQ